MPFSDFSVLQIQFCTKAARLQVHTSFRVTKERNANEINLKQIFHCAKACLPEAAYHCSRVRSWFEVIKYFGLLHKLEIMLIHNQNFSNKISCIDCI